jgi:hypothetical protein
MQVPLGWWRISCDLALLTLVQFAVKIFNPLFAHELQQEVKNLEKVASLQPFVSCVAGVLESENALLLQPIGIHFIGSSTKERPDMVHLRRCASYPLMLMSSYCFLQCAFRVSC